MKAAFSAFSYFGSGDVHSSSTFLYLIQNTLTFHPIIREILNIYCMKLVSYWSDLWQNVNKDFVFHFLVKHVPKFCLEVRYNPYKREGQNWNRNVEARKCRTRCNWLRILLCHTPSPDSQLYVRVSDMFLILYLYSCIMYGSI